jgi:hypothetical protein
LRFATACQSENGGDGGSDQSNATDGLPDGLALILAKGCPYLLSDDLEQEKVSERSEL